MEQRVGYSEVIDYSHRVLWMADMTATTTRMKKAMEQFEVQVVIYYCNYYFIVSVTIISTQCSVLPWKEWQWTVMELDWWWW